MSVDNIVNVLIPQARAGIPAGFGPESSVTGLKHYDTPNATTLTVVIPPWHANERVQNVLAAQLVRQGSSVLAYSFDDSILSSRPDLVIDCFDNIAETVAVDLEKYHYDEIDKVQFVGLSLGCAILPYVMGKNGYSGTATLVAPGGDMAESLWTGIRTKHLKADFERQGIDLAELTRRWQTLSPTYQAEHNLRDSVFNLHVSLGDKVIRPQNLQPFVETLERHGNTVNQRVNRYLGHYGTIIKSAFGQTVVAG